MEDMGGELGETKIKKLEMTVSGEHNVVRLDVSVNVILLHTRPERIPDHLVADSSSAALSLRTSP